MALLLCERQQLGGHHGLQDYRHICYYFYVFYVFYVFFKIQKVVTFYVFAVFRTFSRTMDQTMNTHFLSPLQWLTVLTGST